MAAKTVHVFRSDGSWLVKREGKPGKIFVTQREAIDAARKIVKRDSAGQFVVYRRDGQIKEHGAHGMTQIQYPPKKSDRASDIARAVSQVVLKRVQSQNHERPTKS